MKLDNVHQSDSRVAFIIVLQVSSGTPSFKMIFESKKKLIFSNLVSVDH